MHRDFRHITAAIISLALALAVPASAQALGLEKVGSIVPTGVNGGLLSPMGLWYDGFRGRLIVANTEANQVVLLDSLGAVEKVLGRGGKLRLPRAVAATRDGRLFIAEREEEVLKVLTGYDTEVGESYRSLDLVPFRRSQPVHPVALFAAEDGTLYVADRGNRQILVFGPDEAFRFAISKVGEPADLWVSSGNIFLAEPGFGGVRLYDGAGRWLRTLGDDPVRFSVPLRARSLAADRRERLWVIEETGGIRALDLAGNPLFFLPAGGLFAAIDLAIDPEQNLYVLEQGGGRISVFRINEF